MANTIARIGSGTVVQYCATVAGTYTTLGEVVGVKIPKIGTDAVEATTLSSASYFKEFISGLVTIGEAAIRINYGSEDVSHALMVLAAKTRVKYFWKIILIGATGTPLTTTGTFGPFLCIVTGFEAGEVTAPGVLSATISLQYTGDANGIVIPV